MPEHAHVKAVHVVVFLPLPPWLSGALKPCTTPRADLYTSITLPPSSCAASCDEVISKLMPVNYGAKGLPSGLLRIDHMINQQGYTLINHGFSNSLVSFCASPLSLSLG